MKFIAALLLTTVLTMTTACAQKDWIDRTLVTVDVTGVWTGGVEGSGGTGLSGGAFEFELAQQGSTVKGSVRGDSRGLGCQGGNVGPIEGTLAGDVFRFRDSRNCLEAELTVSGDEMAGRVSSFAGSRAFSLRRADPSSRPASPPR